MLSVKQGSYQLPFFESLVWLNLRLNPGLPDHWRTLYSLSQWPSSKRKARWQLHKNTASNIEQVQEAAPYKAPITKSIQVRRTRHAGHCRRRRDELISDILQWIPSHGWAKAGRPARTYIQQLYANTGCSLEDLPEAMNNREVGVGEGQGDLCWWHDLMMMMEFYKK